MRRTSIVLAALLAAATSAVAMPNDHEFEPPQPFTPFGPGLGGARAAPAAPAYLTASRLAAVDDGALAIDADSGALLRVDHAGAKAAELAVGRDAGLLAYDPVARTAYVADRRGDRVDVITLAHGLTLARTWTTPAEPYGVALSLDRTTALVTTIADRALVAYDVRSGREAWRVALGAEPRGVAVSTDGARAMVSYLATGTVDEIALAAPHDVAHVALDPRGGVARGGFTATYVGPRFAIAAFQADTPGGSFTGDEGRYGGGFEPPIRYQLAFLDRAGGRQQGATVSANQPRAVAWDGARDALYVAGLGNDDVVQILRASQVDPEQGMSVSLVGEGDFPHADRCGADGLAIAPGGDVLVWCSFTRSVTRLDLSDAARLHANPGVAHGPTLVASALDRRQHLGMVVFHAADPNISAFGGVACAGCHLDGRTDGNSWAIGGRALQTPLLAGRLVGTAPFKWDGGAANLRASLTQTIARLGGDGLSKPQLAALQAYLEAMPPVRTPTRDAAAIARGKALFESSELGCAGCHDGPAYTDRTRHAFRGTLPESDTPSLIGLAASAPYFHDGSAATLEAVVRDRGLVHGMAASARTLDDAKVADLVAYLETR
jgi:mono/diheme cytochrome c family protein